MMHRAVGVSEGLRVNAELARQPLLRSDDLALEGVTPERRHVEVRAGMRAEVDSSLLECAELLPVEQWLHGYSTILSSSPDVARAHGIGDDEECRGKVVLQQQRRSDAPEARQPIVEGDGDGVLDRGSAHDPT